MSWQIRSLYILSESPLHALHSCNRHRKLTLAPCSRPFSVCDVLFQLLKCARFIRVSGAMRPGDLAGQAMSTSRTHDPHIIQLRAVAPSRSNQLTVNV